MQQPHLIRLISEYLAVSGEDSAKSAKSIADLVKETLECLKAGRSQTRPDRLVLVDVEYEIQITNSPPLVSSAFNRASISEDNDDLVDISDGIGRFLVDETRLLGFDMTTSHNLLIALIERVRREERETVLQLIGMVTYLGQYDLVPVGFSHEGDRDIFRATQISRR